MIVRGRLNLDSFSSSLKDDENQLKIAEAAQLKMVQPRKQLWQMKQLQQISVVVIEEVPQL